MDLCGDVSGSSFPIVGIGASAGGLEAFTALLQQLPSDTGMAFVLVQHLDPHHESALSQILGRATPLPVQEITNDLELERDHVYVIPPNTTLVVTRGVLRLEPRPSPRTPARSIDSFLESLAQDQRERAIGVLLSGTGTDGTVGLEAIKAEGGITFAQDHTARYDSMPRAAVAAGCADFVLSPAEIAQELARIAKHPVIAGRTPDTAASESEATEASGSDRFENILLLLRNHSGVDFSLYKSSTIRRRIARRLVLSKRDTLASYARFLRGNIRELDALYSDALISVTSFFRNPEVFDVLEHTVLPKLVQQRGDDALRVWVLGCSTGQEAYSIAMTCVEAAERAHRTRGIQIFATDLNVALLERARHGLYGKAIAEELTAERLQRFFVEEERGYRIVKSLREMVVFARQNLIEDPPLSRMDLISCRNLLIYLEPGLQKEVLPVFHYALKPGGYLVLGPSESIGGLSELFEPVDKRQQIYSKRSGATPAFRLPAKSMRGEPPHVGPREESGELPRPGTEHGLRAELNAQREADRVTVNQFAPPAVLVNADLQVLQFRGGTGAYLEPPAGKASFDVLKMAREGLMLPLRAALQKAQKENKPARKENVPVQQNGRTGRVDLAVIPLKNLRERHFLILFEDPERSGPRSEPASRPGRRGKRAAGPSAASAGRSPRDGAARRIAELEAELAETRDFAQAMEEQHDATHEELQAANEELQSANEEQQSINEELETSKEELESANEELTTVNEEMSHRNAELNRLNGDLVNIQTAAAQAILLLGRDLTIRRFSARAGTQFQLLPADLGAPLSRIRPALGMFNVDEPVRHAIDSVRPVEREVQDRDGRWFSLRVSPYITLDDTVDGAVLLLVDIDDLKRAEAVVAAARNYAEKIVDTVPDPLLVLDRDLRVERANSAFYRAFRVAPEDSIGRLLYDLGRGQWNIPRLRELLGGVVSTSMPVEGFLVEHEFEQIGRRSMLLNARRILDASRELILLSIEDVTELRRAEQELQRSVRLLEERAAQLDRFNRLAVGRELRMIDLKKEVNELCERYGEAARYRLDFEREVTGHGAPDVDREGGSSRGSG